MHSDDGEWGELTAIDHVKSAFLTSAYGKLTPHLMKYSASLAEGQLIARVVVLDTIGEEELDTVLDILGDVVGHLGGTADFELVEARSRSEAKESPALPILLYWAYSLDAEE